MSCSQRDARRLRPFIAIAVLTTLGALLSATLLAAQQPILDELERVPACRALPGPPRSVLPALEGQYGVEQPYMGLMRALGVRRAKIEVRGTWRHGALRDPAVVKRLYFRCYECPFAQMTDLRRLVEIDRSPLRAALDAAALGRTRAATPPNAMDHSPRIEGKLVQVWETFFDIPRAPGAGLVTPAENGVWPVDRKAWAEAQAAVDDDDALGLMCMIRNRALTNSQLQDLLCEAARSFYRNRVAEIELLVSWGANPNMPDRNGDLPLVGASNPLNVAALLLLGAEPNAKDGLGRSALDIARWQAKNNPNSSTQCVSALLTAAAGRSTTRDSKP